MLSEDCKQSQVNKYVNFFSLSFILITPQSLGLNAIPKITWRLFRGQRGKKRGSFRGRDHPGVDLGIISGAVQFS